MKKENVRIEKEKNNKATQVTKSINKKRKTHKSNKQYIIDKRTKK